MGLARLGMLVNFVSDSVIVGFTAGAGTLIVVNQLRNLLRLPFPTDPDLVDTIADTLRYLGQTHWPSLLLGLITIGIVFGIQWANRTRRSGKLPLPGPLIALSGASGIGVLMQLGGWEIKVIGAIPRSLPPLAHIPLTDLRLIGSLSSGAFAIAAIGLVEAVSIARSIASQTRQRLDSNQEFVGQGLANIASAVFSGYACSGSFTRSAVNYKVGGRTPLANVFSGLFTLLLMLVFAPLAAYIPMSALAGVLIITAIGLIDRREMTRIWGSGGDRIIMVVTLLATLFLPLQFAVLTGILMSLAYYVLKTSMPRVRTVLPDVRFEHFTHQPDKPACPQLGIIEILGDLYFGAVHHVEECIERNLAENPNQRFLLLRMQSIGQIDISGIHALENVMRSYRERGGDIFLTRVRGPVAEVMRASGFERRLGSDHHLLHDNAVSHLFYRELDPAICIYECPVRAFRECQNLPKSLPDEGNGSAAALRLPPVSKRIEETLIFLGPEAVWDALHTLAPPLVVDVREMREFRRGHIPGAQSLPLSALLAEPDLDSLTTLARQDRLVIFVCRGGRRSRGVAALAVAHGSQHIAVLRGGMLAWEAAKLLEAVDEIV
jgi:SulP family sulfate permease